ncbi:MAG: class I SAM-dependent methyltransferase [Microcystaceae cyanobacterium]
MGLDIIQRLPWLTQLMLPLWNWDARQKFKRLEPWLNRQDLTLELGSGLGTVTHYFRQQGCKIVPLDIQNTSLFSQVKPIIYDGQKIPFDDKVFPNVLLLTVLHHTVDVVSVLCEAKRVGHKIMIIEDIYQNKLQQYLTYTVDSLVNFEFQEHPHNNRTDEEWQKLFERLNLKLVHTEKYSLLLLFQQVIYILEA